VRATCEIAIHDLKILFAMSSPEYLRFYDETIVELARRGHDVALAVAMVRDGKPVRFDAIQQAHPRITFAGLLPARDDRWAALARAVRGTMDFVRYWHPDLASATLLRQRVKRQGLPWTLQWLDGAKAWSARTVGGVMRALTACERAIPPARNVARVLDDHAPDLVLVSPLVEPASDQVDVIKAAQARGTRVGTLVASWDNLTNKGDLKIATDLIAVWNEAQKREAVEYHRVAPERVVVTGAQPFDRWFDRRASRTREEFCREVGLPPERPFVLFTGSSIFIARAEVEMPFVRQWIDALRSSGDPVVRDLAVLVRPHPYNGRAWNPDVFAGMPGVAVWPRGGYDPVDEGNRAGLFDSLHHCEAVVGINTSAMIEAAIVGRPVLSVETAQFAGSQEGTLHYRHLLPENGGFLRVAATLDDHVRQLGDVLRNREAVRGELARFVGSFIRPQGVQTPSMARLADALERYGSAAAPAPVRRSLASRVLAALLAPLILAAPLLLAPSERKRHRAGRGTSPRSRGRPTERAGAAHTASRAVWMRVVVVAPALTATLLAAGFAAGELLGGHPFSYSRPRNIAEAAAMGSGAEVLRLLRAGEDPRAIMDVRSELISSNITRVNAVEAAVWGRRVQLLRMLERHGAIEGDDMKRYVACLATLARVPSIVEEFATSGTGECDEEQVARALEARAQ
jgi:hypothetical protein